MTLGHRGWFNWMSDERYLKIAYRIKMGQKLHLDNPVTFSEKLQWLKLYDHNSQYTAMVDKYAVKEFIAKRVGEEYVIPTLGVWKNTDEIDFDSLPDKFIVKATHDSGSYAICRSKDTFDFTSAKRRLKRCLRHNYYWGGREWPYKNIEPKIIAEPLIEEPEKMKEFKFFCFNEEPVFFQSITDRTHADGPILQFHDINGVRLDIIDAVYKCRQGGPFELLPDNLEDLIRLSRILAKNTSFLRVDFFETDSRIYVGELTFFESGGFCRFTPEEWNRRLGDWITLPKH